jgi:MurNAc alpha-1-phosphate uridylyltransferase
MPTIVIIAGGLATRLYPITKTVPKSMLEVAHEPFISYQLKLLKKKGMERVVICSGYLGEQIQKYVGNGSQYGLEVLYSFDGEKLLGTGGALKKALPLVGDIFWVMYGDSYLDTDYQAILCYFLSLDAKGLMAVHKNENRWDRSNVLYDNGVILAYDKKDPTTEMKHIDYGLAILRKGVFTSFIMIEVFDLADLYVSLVDKREMLGYEVKERFYEIGSHDGLEQTKNYLERKDGNGNGI